MWQANVLVALHTNITHIIPVLSLSHLVVHEYGADFTFLSKTLPLFGSLKTLCLGDSRWPKVARIPMLHLDGLTQLQRISGYGVARQHSATRSL